MNPNPPKPPASAPAPPPLAPRRARRCRSEALFAGADELVIEHRGADYRLRQTSQGKLILTK